jgi:Na+/citrate or Na+/malate symporter
MIKEILKMASFIIAGMVGAIIFGWGLGAIAGKFFIAPALAASPPVWYCIEGKIYEKVSDVYVTVNPARSCLPVIKD